MMIFAPIWIGAPIIGRGSALAITPHCLPQRAKGESGSYTSDYCSNHHE